MKERAGLAQGEVPPRSRAGTYTAVVVVEALVVAALWFFGRYFSA